MRVRFWGTRGSLAKPGPTTLRYGGNTPCVEVRTADGSLIVLDCGTGAHGLGLAVSALGRGNVRGHLLITHTHWDHIQGFPFFGPLFARGNEWHIYAPGGLGHRLEDTLSGQMQYEYFPVTLEQLGAQIHYHDLVEGSFEIAGVRIIARYLNHPALTLGYRLESGGVAVVYATDHEPNFRQSLDKESSLSCSLPVHPEDRRHVEFLAEADLVIHDSQYTADEYPRYVGWGHTAAEQAVDFAIAAGARRLALFHHDPMHDDDVLDALVDTCRQRAASASNLEVFGAAEGQVIDLPESRDVSPPGSSRSEPPAIVASAGPGAPPAVLVVDGDPDSQRLLLSALRPDGYRLLSASNGEAAIQIARAERPALILLGWRLPGRDGLEVCRALRGDADPQIRDAPIVLLTALTRAADTAAGLAAGATDYLTEPFAPAHVRARVRGWLLRTRVQAATVMQGDRGGRVVGEADGD